MARMLGPVPGDRWEKNVYHQLKLQLPADWSVVANVTWTLSTDGSYVRDGQADFVVLAPGLGMIVLEVKGTREFWIAEDGRWYRKAQNGEAVQLSESPPEQAMRNMHQLAEVVRAKGGWTGFPGRYAYIVAYPNGEASRVPTMFDESTLVTSRQMHDLARRLRHSIERRGLGQHSTGFTEPVASRVARLLTSRPFVVTKADTPEDVRDDVARVDELTSQQYAALRGIFDLARVAVVGPAGSGKTLLAIWRLRALLEEGKRALFVCFNKDLAAVLRQRNPDEAEAITNVDRLFRGLVPSARIPAAPDRISEFFRQELPSLVLDVASSLPVEQKYDAIIVDEGQDFSEEQLIALHDLLSGAESQWVFFADWRQDLFRAGKGGAVGADVVFRLHHNCRNTTSVNSATNAYLRQHIDSMPGMPAGHAPIVERCPSREAMALRAWELAKQWDSGTGVVILSPFRLEHSAMARSPRGHGLALTDDIGQFGRPGTVYFSTIRSFKGIEAAGVILVDTDVPAAGSLLTEEDLYVACTRPTARLAVLTTSEQAIQWLAAADPVS